MKHADKPETRRVKLGNTTYYLGAMPGESADECLKRIRVSQNAISDDQQGKVDPAKDASRIEP